MVDKILKILVINDNLPNVRTTITEIFKNIIPIINQKSKVKIFWFVTNEYVKSNEMDNSEYEIIFKSNFKNAREVIEKINPSFIWVLPGTSIIEYCFLKTGKFFNIPIFGWGNEIPSFALAYDKRKKIREGIRQFFEFDKNDKSILKIRGITYLKKYLFVIKSLKAIGKKYPEIISEILLMLKSNSGIMYSKENEMNAKFNCDLIFASHKKSRDFLVKKGYINNIKITGNPTWDEAFTKRENQMHEKSNERKKVLFFTVNLTSGQGRSDWTINKRNTMIKELVSEYKKLNNNISLQIKIHPTSENYKEYEQELNKYKTDIELFQFEDHYKLIKESDIILTNSSHTAAIISIILRKPVIIWNYFNVHNDVLLENNAALRCKNISELENCLKNVQTFTKNNQSKINDFINNFCGTGNASKNIVDEIEKFMIEKG
jgi:hypothetical protein